VYQAATSDIAPYSWAYPKDLQFYNNDPAEARALLDQAGWVPGADGIRVKDGKRLELQLSYISGNVMGSTLAAITQQRLKDVGILLTQKVYPSPLYFAAAQEGGIINDGKYQMAYFGWVSGVDPDNSSLYACDQFPPAGQNNLFWCDKKLDDAEKDTLGTFDQARRIHGSYPRADDASEIGSKCGEGPSQCVRFGSDQADRPVTTSNCFRSELTTCGASSFVERCSRSEMILVRAASTSVMARSEKYGRCC